MAFEAIKQFEIIPIRKMNLDLTESLKLFVEKNIYAYDAYMLQCSLTFSKPLLSLDKTLTEVARQLKIKIIELES